LNGFGWTRRIRETRAGRRRAGQPVGAALKVGDFLSRVVESSRRSALAWYHVARGRTVVYDRFPLPPVPGERRGASRRIRGRLLAGFAPTPDLYVLLDAPGDVLYGRKGEHSPAILEGMRGTLDRIVNGTRRVERFDACATPEVLRRRVTALIWSLYV